MASNFQFNIAAGRTIELANRVVASDPTNAVFTWVALQSAGLEADAVLQDYATLAALLAGASNEAANAGYARIEDTAITVAVDNTNNRITLDQADPSWAAVAAAGGAWGAILLCYDSDSTGGTDANIVPLLKWSFLRTPNGGAITVVLPVGGYFWQPSNPS